MASYVCSKCDSAKCVCALPLPSTLVIEEISNERIRQRGKGYTAKHDDNHKDESIAIAAAMIADPTGCLMENNNGGWVLSLSMHVCSTKPRRQQLIIASAMLIAEIERIDRKDLAAEIKKLNKEPDHE